MKNLKNALKLESNYNSVHYGNEIIAGNMNLINHYTTKLRQEQYKEGKIDLEKLQSCAIKSMQRKMKKSLDKKLKELEEINNINDSFESIYIQLDTKKTYYGWQWKATLTIINDNGIKERIEGNFTSGYGYDKESTSISQVLNEYKPLIKMLYSFKNEAMGKSEHLKIDNRELFGYGSGYGTLPYFESGVGTSCYYKILDTIGLEMKCINDSLYVITRK